MEFCTRHLTYLQQLLIILFMIIVVLGPSDAHPANFTLSSLLSPLNATLFDLRDLLTPDPPPQVLAPGVFRLPHWFPKQGSTVSRQKKDLVYIYLQEMIVLACGAYQAIQERGTGDVLFQRYFRTEDEEIVASKYS